MTIVQRLAVTAALQRALALSPARAAAIAVVAQATALPEETVAECLPQCSLCRVVLSGEEAHYFDGTCEQCQGTHEADVFNLQEDGHA